MNWSHGSVNTPQMVTELLRRRATENLIAFTEYTFPNYRAAPPHHKIAEALEIIAGGVADVRHCAYPLKDARLAFELSDYRPVKLNSLMRAELS